jgi:diguanylate cyclase (GGDEF)-like protein
VVELRNGRTVAIQHQPMPDGGWVATHEDITERRRADAKIAFLARHDVLTGLANRALLHERLGQAFAAGRRGAEFAVLFLDLDRFKSINDTMGHPFGDELLRAVAARLLACARDVDTVARLGGDEFVILQVAMKMPGHAAQLADRIINAFEEPFRVHGQEVTVATSIGVAVAPADGGDADSLLKNADLALYIAKGEGRGRFRFFEPEMDARVQLRHGLEQELRAALAQDRFEIHYQPLVDVRTGRVRAFEALLRWNHPLRGLVAPDEFIPIAEECGLIVPIGEWVLGEACREAARWPDGIGLAVNLSPVQIRAPGFVPMVQRALADSTLPPERLELEITETVLLQNNEAELAILHRLRGLGIAIALDDFGVGYSSLGYLRRFSFDKVKIDRSFVQDLTRRDDALFIVRAILGLCASLGVRTTAEGVETQAQYDILVREGCAEVQGYLFGRPTAAEGLGRFVGENRLAALASGG